MPSFDVVSEVDKHELTNAVDQASRELENRFDFRGVEASFSLEESVITLEAPSDFQLKQMMDILRGKLAARKIDLKAIEEKEPEISLGRARQTVAMKQGIDKAEAKQLIKALKDAKLKVEAQINGEKLRVTGKKRDDLQAAMALLRKADAGLPLQFENLRD